jgi:NTP pyrophosphatase (non-canonical NTP hydrolase)
MPDRCVKMIDGKMCGLASNSGRHMLANPNGHTFGESSLHNLQQTAWQIAEDHGWHESPRTPGDLIALIHTELSEAFEEIRNGRPPNAVTYEGKPEGFGVELADAVIRILDVCGIYDIDLEKLLVEKMEFNRTRSYRHGGKVV